MGDVPRAAFRVRGLLALEYTAEDWYNTENRGGMDMTEHIISVSDPALPLYSNLANISAVLNTMEDINWCGFYIAQGETLYVGPFQGEPACTRIPFGKGVCGTAAERKAAVIVPDVREFPGHIACSALSASEIVVPIMRDGRVLGVIDIDSPSLDRFDESDRAELERAAEFIATLFPPDAKPAD